MTKYKCNVCRDTLIVFVDFNCPFCVPKKSKRKVGQYIKTKGEKND